MTKSTTRERLVDAAVEAFAEGGFQGTTTRQIAALADANPGLIKHYFDSKDALYREAVAQVFGVIDREVLDPRDDDSDDPRTRAAQFLERFIRFNASYPQLHRLLTLEGKHQSPRLQWIVETQMLPRFVRATTANPEWLQLVPPGLTPEHFGLSLLGACTHVYADWALFSALDGRDFTREDSVKSHVRAVLFMAGLAPSNR